VTDKKRIVFVSSMEGSPWGGSEELWVGAAANLASKGSLVGASVHGWSPPPARITGLINAGVHVQLRRAKYSLFSRICNKVVAPGKRIQEIEAIRFLDSQPLALVVLCDPAATPPIELLQHCVSRKYPFATISQANSDHFWPDDVAAEAYRRCLPVARRCYFVSRANKVLFERQIGCELPNAKIVWNPYNVSFNAAPPWPSLSETDELRLASVARLHPPSKGQDLLLEALTGSAWKERKWSLTFYGEGPMRNCLERMTEQFDLEKHVKFAGFVSSVEEIWARNHALIAPSRYEGMPLCVLEAMMCGRPVVATDLAGHSEIIEDGVTGFLAEAATASSVARALERLWTQRINLQMMGSIAAKNVRKRVPRDPALALAEDIKSATI
jgi:glycosyltransferase involved in cell wall biosynthesis